MRRNKKAKFVRLKKFVKVLKKLFGPPKERIVTPHEPSVLFRVILVLIMTSAVLIIPTVDKAYLFQEKYNEYKVENLMETDENAKAFVESQIKRFENKTGTATFSFLFSSGCAIVSVLGVMGYLNKNMKIFVNAVNVGVILLLVSLLFLVYSIVI